MIEKNTNLDEPAINYYFSFGHGQEHFGKYVKIRGTMMSSREEMFRRFGDKWSMQYSEEDALRVIERWKLEELISGN